MNDKKREITDWEKAECLTLKALVDAFNAGKSRSESLTQGKIADRLEISQGSVSSYLNGYNALNARVAGVIAGMIGVPVDKFSPRLAKEIAAMAQAVQPKQEQATPDAEQAESGQSLPEVARYITQAVARNLLNQDDLKELHRLATHLVKKNQPPVPIVEVPEALAGLAEAALKAAENNQNPDDLLKMLEKGMKKHRPKDESARHGKKTNRAR